MAYMQSLLGKYLKYESSFGILTLLFKDSEFSSNKSYIV